MASSLSFEAFTGDAEAWSALVEPFPDRPLVQSWAHGEARARSGPWRAERGVFVDEDGKPAGFVQAMVRDAPLGLGRLIWIARGPVFDTAADTRAGFPAWTAMAAALRARYARAPGDYLRIAPPVAEDAGAPVPDGFRATAMDGWASAVVDLTRSEDELRAGLYRKWRGHLNKAEREGVAVDAETGAGAVDRYAQAHDRFMAQADAQGSVAGELLTGLASAGGDGSDLVVYTARIGGAEAGRLLAVRTGSRAEYLASHLNDAGRRANAGQALVWRALIDAKAAGAERFDVGGMDPERTTKGIYEFKDGIRGTPYRLMNEIDACGGPLARLVKMRTDRARARMGA